MAKDNNNDPKAGLPDKQQLSILLQRYSNIQIFPIDNGQDPITISSETAQYKKPIYINSDLGKVTKKIEMAMQHQAAFPQNNGEGKLSRIVVNGNLDLVKKAIDGHTKLLGDDPYNPKQPYDRPLNIMEGVNIPEYEVMDLPDNIGTSDADSDKSKS